MIILAADHGGFKLKEFLKKYLNSKGYEVWDAGNTKLDPEDDYPDFVKAAIKKLQIDRLNNRAIMACRSGSGEVITANKFSGVRAHISWTPEHAKMARVDDDANVLVLPTDYITEEEAQKIVGVWLTTPFSNEKRHIRRLEKINDIERELEKEKVTGII
jgi:ribose 5-phosphate isomerase B